MKPSWLLSIFAIACTPRAPPADLGEAPMTCDSAMIATIERHVEGERVMLLKVWSPDVCGRMPQPAPEKIAELQLGPADTSCPIGVMGVHTWSSGFASALPGFTSTLSAGHLQDVRAALAAFGQSATGWVLDCHSGGADWLVVGDDRGTTTVGFLAPGETSVRRTPGHPRVVFPQVDLPTPSSVIGVEVEHPLRDGCPATPLVPTWATRVYFSAPKLPGNDVVERWAWSESGTKVTLVHERRELKRGDTTWACTASQTLEGSLTVTGRTRAMTFGDSTLTCTPRTLQLAPPSAVRVPLPPREEDCARHGWSTTQRLRVAGLTCRWESGSAPAWVSSAPLVVAASPGTERLVLDADDCGSRDLVYEPLRAATEGDPLAPRK